METLDHELGSWMPLINQVSVLQFTPYTVPTALLIPNEHHFYWKYAQLYFFSWASSDPTFSMNAWVSYQTEVDTGFEEPVKYETFLNKISMKVGPGSRKDLC